MAATGPSFRPSRFRSGTAIVPSGSAAGTRAICCHYGFRRVAVPGPHSVVAVIGSIRAVVTKTIGSPGGLCSARSLGIFPSAWKCSTRPAIPPAHPAARGRISARYMTSITAGTSSDPSAQALSTGKRRMNWTIMPRLNGHLQTIEIPAGHCRDENQQFAQAAALKAQSGKESSTEPHPDRDPRGCRVRTPDLPREDRHRSQTICPRC